MAVPSTMTFCRLAAMLALVACGRPAGAPRSSSAPLPLAVTLDDLPFVGPNRPGQSKREAVERIIAAGREAGAPLTGFVTCRNFYADGAGLKSWVAGGVELANHSYDHRSIDDLGVDAFAADVARCQSRLTELGVSTSLFRYPFLRTGRSLAVRDAGLAALAAMGLRRVPVSVDTSDWVLVQPYVKALEARDEALSAEITAAYVAHVRESARRSVARAASLGRSRAAHILLLHANALAADHLGALLRGLREDGFRFVPVAEALADPLYAQPDFYAGPVGMSWLYRVERGGERGWQWDHAQMEALRTRFGD